MLYIHYNMYYNYVAGEFNDEFSYLTTLTYFTYSYIIKISVNNGCDYHILYVILYSIIV